jgi:hypothetical protein
MRLLRFGSAVPAGWVDPCDEGGDEPFTGHSVWGELLEQFVVRGTIAGVETNLVNYARLEQDDSKLRSYLRQLCKVDTSTMSAQEKIAMYCNAYNALITLYVVHFKPPDSILQLSDRDGFGGKVWSAKLGTVANQKVSLDTIEHDIVRATLTGEVGVKGRIHACFVCASLSCPDLQMVPFEGSTLVDQLSDGVRAWLSNPTKNPGPDGGKLRLSKIFDWYGGDFVAADGSVQKFVKKYSSWTVADNAGLEYIDYHWGLNAVNGTGVNVNSAVVRRSRSSSVIVMVLSVLFFFGPAYGVGAQY